MSARKVVVVMPFGDRKYRRRAILNFKRVEYLVRMQCDVKTKSGENVAYAVNVARTNLNDIPTKCLDEICSADILIALFTEDNRNVTYEVAHRLARGRGTAMREKLILLAKSSNDLPLYLQQLPYCNWNQENVLKRIEKIAEDDSPELADFFVGIPDALKSDIDHCDSELKAALERTLNDIESHFEPEPTPAVQYLRGFISEEDIWSFYPCSIVEFSFSDRSEYENPESPGIIQDFDERFARLYGYVDKKAAEHDRPLTLQKLGNIISTFVDNLDDFVKEQLKLVNTVVKEHGFARAEIPMLINQNHSHIEYRQTRYLPCVIAESIDGMREGPHKMYLLVVYIKLPGILKVDEPFTHL